jgi:hypothetical protein
MNLPQPILDHVVVNVRDRMDEAAAQYRRLGFFLTERGHHTLGSINHLAIFDTDYFELIGYERDAPNVRVDIKQAPLGLNGLVFRMEGAEALHAVLEAQGVPVEDPVAFSRPVELPEGPADARFKVIRLLRDAAPGGRIYFCEHFTPELVWRDAWRRHPNGVFAIARFVFVATDPARTAQVLERMFGAQAVADIPGGRVLDAGGPRVELLTPPEFARQFGDAVPDAAGRDVFMAALTLRTRSLKAVDEVLERGGIRALRRDPRHLLVGPADAFNTTLEFVE